MDTNDKTARVFFALWPDRTERGALSGWQPPLLARCGGRVMRTDTLHATLVFLGEVEVVQLEALKLAAAEVSVARFELCFDEAHYWGHNHIVYAAPRTLPPQLIELVRELEQNLLRHRFAFERREYKPHVTLLRNAHWTDNPLPGMSQVCWHVREFVLLESAASSYRILARFCLM
ncbi:MAG: RNA 2',3'-cyclic phosphodiesterase [Gallionella sp.]|jgi:2'-5' RNA ligase